ncbi:MAG: NADH-quinone oxidoreductase subunit C, partial [Mangrovicoccus sp.]|nr:NADH-quinone oxidoreductase subunit C [Mangrovicoccus sp.]
MTEQLRELAAHITAARPDSVVSTEIAYGELNLTVTPAALVAFCDFLKSDQTCRFSTLVDITGIDWPERAKRFDVV